MIPQDILRQIRRIEIFTNRMVNETMGGRYESVFKGHGIEFDEVREYQPGDDVRSIDWNVTARMGTPFIKRYVEERELTVMLLVDMSRSMAFSSTSKLKNRLAAELCAVLAFSAIKNHDKVGLVLFTDHVELFIPPKKGARHVLRVIRDVLSFTPTGHGTDLRGALDYLSRVTTRRAVTFVISDFYSGDIRLPLAVANRRHDVIAVHVADPRQETLPDVGWIQMHDAETGEPALLDSRDPEVRRRYAQWWAQHREQLEDTFRAAGVDAIDVRTDRPYVDPLLKFFRMRARRH